MLFTALERLADQPYCGGMRITLDARMMGPTNTRGIGRYIEELVRAMIEVAPEHQYALIVRDPNHPFTGHASVETMVADIPWYGLREQREMPAVFASTKPDVIHVPHWNVPLSTQRNLVVTIHDLLLRHEPASAKISTRGPVVQTVKRLGYRVVLSAALRHATRILVPTDFVRQDVTSFYPATRDRIRVTGEGMPPIDPTPSSPVSPSYLLYVGSAYPHKGLADVFDAWPKIHSDFPELRLKIAGEMDVFMTRFKDRVAQKKLLNIEFLGRAPEQELASLYRGAMACIFPSHFEGFGLPPLEAIAHGCPVIAADAPATVEVLGKAAGTFFRMGEADAILAAVHRVLGAPEEMRRLARAEAPELAHRHSWKLAAERTLRAYSEAR